MLYLVISPDTVLIIINLVRNHLFKINNRTVRSTGQMSLQLTMGFHNRVHWPLLVSRFNVHFEKIQHLVCLILTLNEQLRHFWEEFQYEKYLIWNSWGMVKIILAMLYVVIHLVRTQNFPKSTRILPSDTDTYIYVSGGWKTLAFWITFLTY